MNIKNKGHRDATANNDVCILENKCEHLKLQKFD